MIEKKEDKLEFAKNIDNDELIIDDEEQDVNDRGFVFNNLFKEYENAVVKSLITSFGLDALLIQDRRGGDVDTIHTVRDSSVQGYADKQNKLDYDNRGKYDSHLYHSNKKYIDKNKEISQLKKNGNLQDAYTGKRLPRNADVDLDHTISAKEINDDPGRVLAGIKGEDLANTKTNLNSTNRSINRSKKAKTSNEFLEKLTEESEQRRAKIRELKNKPSLTDKEKSELNKFEKLEEVDVERVKQKEKEARDAYENELAKTYYTSSKFLKATVNSSLKKGTQMGLRQCLGMVLTEVWLTVRDDFPKIADKMQDSFELSEFLKEITKSFKKSFKKVVEKYKELISSFKDGMLAGILSSISSTLINIFFTTAKCVGRILRESWASIVEAVKILVFNPDNLPLGEMLSAIAKIIATSVSVICGSLIQEAVSQMNLIKLPVIADVIPSFMGSMVTGIMSVSMLYFLDHSALIRKIVDYANGLKSEFDLKLEYFKEVNKKLTVYVSGLASIDYDTLEKEIDRLKDINKKLFDAVTVDELNSMLHNIVNNYGIKLPYQSFEELDTFINDKDTILII